MRFLISSICVFSFLSCTFSIADEPAVSQEFLHNVARTTQSMSRLEAMADTGNCAAMQQLGKVHLNTSDTVTLRKDNDFKSYSFTKAADYFRAAVECGLDSSKVWDEYNLKIHKYDNAEKITKKVSWYKEAASDGFPIAQRILAVHLGYGDESLQLLEKSGDSGDNKSLILLASRYTLGLGVNPSPSIAKSYLDQVQSPSPEFLNAWRDLNNSTKGRFSAQYDAAFAGFVAFGGKRYKTCWYPEGANCAPSIHFYSAVSLLTKIFSCSDDIGGSVTRFIQLSLRDRDDCFVAGSAGQRWRIIDTYEMVPLAYNTAKTCFQSKFANCDLTQIYQDNKLAIDTHHKTKYHKAAKDFEMEIATGYAQSDPDFGSGIILLFVTIVAFGLAILMNRKSEKRLNENIINASIKTREQPRDERLTAELADAGFQNKSNSHYRKLIAMAAVAAILLFFPILQDQNFGTATPVLRTLVSFILAFVIGTLAALKLRHPDPTKPTHYAATWFGGMFFLCSILRLPSFFDTLDIEYLAQFGIVITVFGSVTYLAGYAFGRYKISN
jgi:hypothetical protein